MNPTPVHPLAETMPLFGLVLRTPRLALRPAWDEDLPLLADASASGMHPADKMPFASPWSRAPYPELLRGTANSVWRERSSRTPESWAVSFAVRRVDAGVDAWWKAPVIGRQDVMAHDFPLLRSIASGSWLRAAHQGQGLGKEMRHAVLLWAFEHLGATEATSGAYAWNAKSLGTSRSVGYEPNGTRRVTVDGREEVEQLLRLTPELHRRPAWTLHTEGDHEGVRNELGVPPIA